MGWSYATTIFAVLAVVVADVALRITRYASWRLSHPWGFALSFSTPILVVLVLLGGTAIAVDLLWFLVFLLVMRWQASRPKVRSRWEQQARPGDTATGN